MIKEWITCSLSLHTCTEQSRSIDLITTPHSPPQEPVPACPELDSGKNFGRVGGYNHF